jgi:hypothetical protein
MGKFVNSTPAMKNTKNVKSEKRGEKIGRKTKWSAGAW